MKHLLRTNLNFRNFWLASTISTIGDFVDDIAFAQLVYLITKSTMLTGYVFAIKIFFSFVSVFTATFVDKYSKKSILLISSVVQGLILVLLYFLYINNMVTASILIGLVTIQSLFSALITPARNAIISLLVTKEEIMSARVSISIIQQVIEVGSYALSGMLISILGIDFAILFDAVTFFISVYFISKIEKDKSIGFATNRDILPEIKAGFDFVIKDKIIFMVILVTFLGNAAMAPVDSMMPAYLSQNQFSDYSYALFMICTSFGGIIGGLIIDKINKNVENNFILGCGFFIGAIGLVFLYFVNPVIPFLGAFLLGGSLAIVSVLNATIIQIKTPPEMQARAFSFFSCMTYISGPLGIIFVGTIGEHVKMNVLLSCMSIILVFATIVSWMFITMKD